MKHSINSDYLLGWVRMIRLMLDGKSFSGREHNCCFLNTSETRFASVSSVSGLDFPDDARACALVDWDQDGRQDLWLTNRTSPRVRVMRNVHQSPNHWVAVRLQGQECNRDGIGATVEVTVSAAAIKAGESELPVEAGPENREPKTEIRNNTMVKTLRAGEGFLSQNSKWIHFGLADHEVVQRLTVRWPDGSSDEFTEVPGDRRYLIHQGTDEVIEWSAPRETPQLEASRVDPIPMTEQSRIVLAAPPSAEEVTVADHDEITAPLADLIHGKSVINFWQTSCPPCLTELAEWSQEAARFDEAGLAVIAVHIDDPDLGIADQRLAADEFLDQIDFPFSRAYMSPEALEEFDIYLKTLLQRHQRFVLPTSLLARADGHIVVVYKGPVEIDPLVADVELVYLESAMLLDRSLAFSGRWLRRPSFHEESDDD